MKVKDTLLELLGIKRKRRRKKIKGPAPENKVLGRADENKSNLGR